MSSNSKQSTKETAIPIIHPVPQSSAVEREQPTKETTIPIIHPSPQSGAVERERPTKETIASIKNKVSGRLRAYLLPPPKREKPSAWLQSCLLPQEVTIYYKDVSALSEGFVPLVIGIFLFIGGVFALIFAGIDAGICFSFLFACGIVSIVIGLRSTQEVLGTERRFIICTNRFLFKKIDDITYEAFSGILVKYEWNGMESNSSSVLRF